MVFQWGLNDRKYPKVYRTLLKILADLSIAVILMVCTRPLISKSSRPCTNPLVTLPREPIIIGISVIFLFNNFIQFFFKVPVHIFLSVFFHFSFLVNLDGKVHNSVSSLFLLIITRSSRLAEISKSVYTSKS